MLPLTTLNIPGNNTNNQSLFTPPSGGDIILKSSDDVEFLVHSTHLKLASSVFADMIATGTQNDIVKLTEDAIGISYLLRFIYPNRLPLTIDPDALPVYLTVVQKYDVGGALELIDELIVLNTPPHKLLSSDPIRIHQLAGQFNLVKTRVAAAPLITSDHVDFCDLDKVAELARKYSSLRLVYLMNIQAMRAKVLSDVLFKYNSEPIKPTGSDQGVYWYLSCGDCQSRNVKNRETFMKIPPSWVLAWTRHVYETLLVSSEPIAAMCDLQLFQSSVFERFKGREDMCQKCLSDYADYPSQGPKFDRWAGGIKSALEAQLAKLELVYAL
ncbi:Broad-Complex, Tramtrack and Bric a brac, partial [Rhizoctonia solani]